MNTTVKYIAPWLAAAAISGAIGLAPMASAASATTPVSQAAGPTAPATPFEYGTSPLVEGNVGADPAIPYFPEPGDPSEPGDLAMGRPF
jgi:hypothetical protein